MSRLVSFLILTLPLLAGSRTFIFTFSPEDMLVNKVDGYWLVEMKGADVLAEVGEPILPYFIKHFVIPPSAEITRVEVIEEDVEYLRVDAILYPGQKPRPFSSKGEVFFTRPKPEIYQSENPYPGITYKSYPTGCKHGWRIGVVDLFPVQYYPRERRLKFIRTIKVTVHYQQGVHPIQTITERQFDVFKQATAHLVINPEEVDDHKPDVRPNSINDINYAIITGTQFVNNWGSLTDWKTKKGYMAEVFSVDTIYKYYTGKDNQEKIRMFIRDYYQNKGLIWTVLAGDYDIVPDRDVYSTYYSPYYIACDWYYCDLDSNWNRDNDIYWGELGDVIPPECYFEVYSGRAPIDNTTDIQNFISKTLIFDKDPPNPSNIRRTVLPSVLLFSGYHGRVVNNYIAGMFPSGWTHYKLEDQYAPATRNSINANNPQFIHIAAHGDRNGTYSYYGQPVFTESDVPYLSNSLPFICNSIACYPGQFDFSYDDCFAEELMNRQSPSGAVGAIFNSRYGFGQPPSMGPSEQLDTCFYQAVCRLDTLWLGVAHAVSKEHFRNAIWSQGLWHYCGTELNLFGDPELYMYLNIPTRLYVSFPDPIPPGTQNFTVTVTDAKAPVEDALVCAYQSGQVHETGRTDASGQVTLSINPVAGQMFVTASCFNYLPVEDTCEVVPGVSEGWSSLARSGVWLTTNLIRDRMTINYAFTNRGRLEIVLYNSIGAEICNVFKGSLEGKGAITRSVEQLPSGVYFLKIKGSVSRIERVLIVH
ncbi:MAG TPA: hypothetical protein EYP24_03875 [bacterium (Candidatus Stahlbacteria)]|nr:hypothetical protein [Candidatus Stahlbacteria bacterium]